MKLEELLHLELGIASLHLQALCSSINGVRNGFKIYIMFMNKSSSISRYICLIPVIFSMIVYSGTDDY